MAEDNENLQAAAAGDESAGSAGDAAAGVEEATRADSPTQATASAAAEPAAPVEVLAPKERRARARAARAARSKPKGPRTAQERQAERDRERRAKASARRVERSRSREKAKAAGSGEPTPPREHGPGTQKVRQGVVVSDKADKTITVRIDVARRHRRYEKIVRTSRTLHAHDESNDAHVGDTVVVRECRPLSRSKRWRLVEVVERAR
jgi:small subunit ribosomal protein S17